MTPPITSASGRAWPWLKNPLEFRFRSPPSPGLEFGGLVEAEHSFISLSCGHLVSQWLIGEQAGYQHAECSLHAAELLGICSSAAITSL